MAVARRMVGASHLGGVPGRALAHQERQRVVGEHTMHCKRPVSVKSRVDLGRPLRAVIIFCLRRFHTALINLNHANFTRESE